MEDKKSRRQEDVPMLSMIFVVDVVDAENFPNDRQSLPYGCDAERRPDVSY
jgi:hypothetical protein